MRHRTPDAEPPAFPPGPPPGGAPDTPPRAVSIADFDEPEGLAAAVPGVEFRATPLARGQFEARLLTIRLGEIALQIGSCSPLMANAAVGAGWAALQLPLKNRGTLQLNGRTAGRQTIGLYGSGAELLRANRQSSTHAALFLPAHAAETLLCPMRGLPITRPGHSGLFDTGLPAWSRLAFMVGHLARRDDAAREELEPAAARAGLRASLLEVAREVLAGAEPGVPARMQRACEGWTRIVRGAEACLRADPARAIYTEELCAALGVSAASLAEAFRQVLGITPHRYLKRRRLAMVRAALRVPDGPPPLVKSVALSHGFWHLGQFAIDYRDLYGEAPSVTLARCRGGHDAGEAAVRAGAPARDDLWRMAG